MISISKINFENSENQKSTKFHSLILEDESFRVSTTIRCYSIECVKYSIKLSIIRLYIHIQMKDLVSLWLLIYFNFNFDFLSA